MSIITKVEKQKYNKNRYSIFIDEEYGFSVSEDILIKHSLFKGTKINKEFVDDVLIEEEKIKARDIALNFLGYRMRSSKEIEDKLKLEGYEEYSSYVLSYLESYNYIDDYKFAESFAKDKINISEFGHNRIKIELLRKGIRESEINKILEKYKDSSFEEKTVRELALKKINGIYRDDDKDAKFRKTYGYLYRRGFSKEIIIKILKEII